MALLGRTKTGRRSTIVLIVALLMIVGVVAAAGAAPAEKRDVCHYVAGTDTYHLINVSDNAYDAHIAHDDAAPDEDVPGSPGWIFDADCTPYHSYWLNYGYWDLLPQTVFDLGGVYENDHVLNAIAEGYAGTIEFTEWANPELVEYWFDFTNLTPFTTYEVWLDNDGGSGGPFELVGTFLADASGVGEFDYGPLTFATGTELNYSFWVNEGGWTVLKTDTDLSYTTH